MSRDVVDGWPVLVLRLLLGSMFVLHGWPKLLGAFAGPGVAAFGKSVQTIGFSPGLFWAWVVTIVEFFGGLCLIAGFLTRPAAALITIEMIVAGVRVNMPRGGFFWTKGGFEVPLVFAVLGAILVFTGPGTPSVDRALGLEPRRARPAPRGQPLRRGLP
jgi:putative oxidoreductase